MKTVVKRILNVIPYTRYSKRRRYAHAVAGIAAGLRRFSPTKDFGKRGGISEQTLDRLLRGWGTADSVCAGISRKRAVWQDLHSRDKLSPPFLDGGPRKRSLHIVPDTMIEEAGTWLKAAWT